MQTIRMLKTVPGYPDGLTRVVYVEGQEYNIPEDLFRSFVSMGVVELVLETKPVPPLEKKPLKTRARREI